MFKILFESFLKTKEMRVGKTIKATITKIDKNNVWLDTGLKSEAILSKNIFQTEKEIKSLKTGNTIDVFLEAIDNNLGETTISIEKVRKQEYWQSLEIAFSRKTNIKGIITNNIKGGYIVDILNFKGFLPGSLIDNKPTKNFHILLNQQLDFKIIKLDAKRNSIIVSRKAVLEEKEIQEKKFLLQTITVGDILIGLIKNVTSFGVFVDLGGSVDGLLHITDMSWGRIKHPNELVTIGQKIRVKVIKFDINTKKISLGIKQLKEDPWININKNLKIGTKTLGIITNITEYGCFVKIEDGIEGLIHVSEMGWVSKNMNPITNVMLSQKIEVMILEIDIPKRRISLGLKQCTINPWSNFLLKYKVGSIVIAVIKIITEFGLFVSINNNISGLIHSSDISWFHSLHTLQQLKKDMQINTIILALDTEKERISLGIKQLTSDPYFILLKKYSINKKIIITGNILTIKKNKIKILFANNIKSELYIEEKLITPTTNNTVVKCSINKFNLLKRNIIVCIKL